MATNKLKYSFEDYINNPSGKGSAVSATINKDIFEKELLFLEGKNGGPVKYTVYKQSSNNKIVFYIHFLIPSSTVGFFHDVVIEFTSNTSDNSSSRTIKSFTSRFFSNDDNFVYTYAYAFKTHGVLITELEKLLPFRSIVQKPTMRNPDNAMGYNKCIVFAYLVMQRNNLFEKDQLNRIAVTGTLNSIASKIDSFDKKVKERNQITQKAKAKSGKVKEEPTNKIIKSKNLLGDSELLKPLSIKTSKLVKKVKTSSSISSVKKAKKR